MAAFTSQPFSMHSRGVTAFDSGQYFDCSHQLRSAGQELRDISASALLFIYLQSWQSAYVAIITIGSVSFFTYVGTNGASATLNWTLVSFVVLLPTVLLVYLGHCKRERAHEELAAVKTLIQQIFWSFEEKASHRQIVQNLLLSLLGILREYLNARRFYATEYPLGGIPEKMTVVAQARSKQMKRAMLIFRNLSRCPEEGPAGDRPARLVVKLQQAFEHLALLKEYRLPQGLRTLVRLYVVLVIPIFFGPYYADVSDSTKSFVFVLFFAVMMHLGMAALLTVTLAMEDPFTTEGVDGVFCEEVLFEVEQVINGGSDLRVNGFNGGSRESAPPTAVEPPANSLAANGRPGQLEVDMASLHPLPRAGSLPAD